MGWWEDILGGGSNIVKTVQNIITPSPPSVYTPPPTSPPQSPSGYYSGGAGYTPVIVTNKPSGGATYTPITTYNQNVNYPTTLYGTTTPIQYTSPPPVAPPTPLKNTYIPPQQISPTGLPQGVSFTGQIGLVSPKTTPTSTPIKPLSWDALWAAHPEAGVKPIPSTLLTPQKSTIPPAFEKANYNMELILGTMGIGPQKYRQTSTPITTTKPVTSTSPPHILGLGEVISDWWNKPSTYTNAPTKENPFKVDTRYRGGILGDLAFGEKSPEVIKGFEGSIVDSLLGFIPGNKWTPYRDQLVQTDPTQTTQRTLEKTLDTTNANLKTRGQQLDTKLAPLLQQKKEYETQGTYVDNLLKSGTNAKGQWISQEAYDKYNLEAKKYNDQIGSYNINLGEVQPELDKYTLDNDQFNKDIDAARKTGLDTGAYVIRDGKLQENPDLTYDYGEYTKWGVGAGDQVRNLLGFNREQLEAYKTQVESKQGMSGIDTLIGLTPVAREVYYAADPNFHQRQQNTLDQLIFGTGYQLSTHPEHIATAYGTGIVLAAGGEVVGGLAEGLGALAPVAKIATAHPVFAGAVATTAKAAIEVGVPSYFLGMGYWDASKEEREGEAPQGRTMVNIGKQIPSLSALILGGGTFEYGVKPALDKGYLGGFVTKEVKSLPKDSEILGIEKGSAKPLSEKGQAIAAERVRDAAGLPTRRNVGNEIDLVDKDIRTLTKRLDDTRISATERANIEWNIKDLTDQRLGLTRDYQRLTGLSGEALPSNASLLGIQEKILPKIKTTPKIKTNAFGDKILDLGNTKITGGGGSEQILIMKPKSISPIETLKVDTRYQLDLPGNIDMSYTTGDYKAMLRKTLAARKTDLTSNIFAMDDLPGLMDVTPKVRISKLIIEPKMELPGLIEVTPKTKGPTQTLEPKMELPANADIQQFLWDNSSKTKYKLEIEQKNYLKNSWQQQIIQSLLDGTIPSQEDIQAFRMKQIGKTESMLKFDKNQYPVDSWQYQILRKLELQKSGLIDEQTISELSGIEQKQRSYQTQVPTQIQELIQSQKVSQKQNQEQKNDLDLLYISLLDKDNIVDQLEKQTPIQDQLQKVSQKQEQKNDQRLLYIPLLDKITAVDQLEKQLPIQKQEPLQKLKEPPKPPVIPPLRGSAPEGSGGSAGPKAFRKRAHLELAPGAMPEEVSDILFGSAPRRLKPKKKLVITGDIGGIPSYLSDTPGIKYPAVRSEGLNRNINDLLFGSHTAGSPINIGKFGNKQTLRKPTRSENQLDKKMDNILYGSQDKKAKYFKPIVEKRTSVHTTRSENQLDKKMDNILYGDQKPTGFNRKILPKRKQGTTQTEKQLDRKMNNILYGSQNKPVKHRNPEMKAPAYTHNKPTTSNKQLDKTMNDLLYGDKKPLKQQQHSHNNPVYQELTKFAPW